MLEAKNNSFHMSLFSFYQKYYLIPRAFNQVYISGDVEAEAAEDVPVLYLANHSSWWDGLLCFQAYQQTPDRLRHLVMMEEKQLTNLRFFQRLGAFSIDANHPKSLVKTLRYVETEMKAGQKIWIFPQGEIQHQDVRPLTVKKGVIKIMEQFERVAVKFVSIYYFWGEKQKPNAVLAFSEPHVVSREMPDKAAWITANLTAQLDELRAGIISADPLLLANTATLLKKASKSISDRYLNGKEEEK